MIRLCTLGGIGLRDDDGRDFRPVLAQPKRLAVLIALAMSPHGACQRDRLAGLLWPGHAAPFARAVLCLAIRFLRRELEPAAIADFGSRSLALDPAIVTCDAAEFAQACAARNCELALSIYQGDFLDGLFIADVSPEFDDWRERECSRLRRLALDAAATLLALHRDHRELAQAIYWSRRGLVIEPGNESMLRECMTLLCDAGEPASALRAYASFRAHLGHDVDVEPSSKTEDLIAAIRRDRPLELFPPPLPAGDSQYLFEGRPS
ncbi:MAG: AfsR/SARP family transcriptional regulator [Candidatus Levyibacteriota bacterium]